MKNLILAFIIVIVLFCDSCSPIYYVPNTQNIPMLEAQGQSKISASFNLTDATAGGELQAAHAVTNRIAVLANLLYCKAKDDNANGSGKQIELGPGYYKKIANNLIFESYALVGFGNVENIFTKTHYTTKDTIRFDENVKANFYRIGLQPSISYKKKNFDIAFSTKLSNVVYNNIKGNLVNEVNSVLVNEVDDLKKNKNNLFMEPALTISGGSSKFKLQLQLQKSYNLSNAKFKYDDFQLSLGLKYLLMKS